MKRKIVQPFGVMKAIVSSGMVIHDWYKKDDWNKFELVNYFGIDPLKRGLQEGIANGDIIPSRVYEEFPEFKSLI